MDDVSGLAIRLFSKFGCWEGYRAPKRGASGKLTCYPHRSTRLRNVIRVLPHIHGQRCKLCTFCFRYSGSGSPGDKGYNRSLRLSLARD